MSWGAHGHLLDGTLHSDMAKVAAEAAVVARFPAAVTGPTLNPPG